MSSFRNRLREALSDFVEFDDGGGSTKHAGDNEMRASTPAPPHRQHLPAPQPTTDAPAADPETIAVLEQALARSTRRGYDEFRALFAAMESVGEERVRYALTLRAVQASHKLAPADVLASVDDRLRLLKEEEQRFDAALARETERTVGGAGREMEEVAATIAARLAEVRELEARQAALRQTAATAQAELDRTRTEFAAAYASVHATLASERARIAAHGAQPAQ